MGLAISQTRTTVGISAISVSVEVHLSNGLPAFNIVGLPETTVKESKERVRSAIINSQFDFPLGRITVNLSPAHLPKSGSGFDLAIAVGILAASQQIPAKAFDTHEFVAELGLNGQLHRIHSIVPIAIAAKQQNKTLIIAEANAKETSFIHYEKLLLAQTLREVCSYLCLGKDLQHATQQNTFPPHIPNIDWAEVRGQTHAKSAMKIAAFGGHSILLSGPPGSGKTMLAKRFVTLLPELTEEQALEQAIIQSISHQERDYILWKIPPFRAPHHSASHVALVGGGNPPKPGEISLAHHGVLFLDEFPEFQRRAIEALREPLESGYICISRAATQAQFPAKFQLIAAMNPCPCGYADHPEIPCQCSIEQIKRYQKKLSGPVLDRIDIQIRVNPLSQEELLTPHQETNETSADIQMQAIEIHRIQLERQGMLNSNLSAQHCEEVCQLSSTELDFLKQVLTRFKLSARSFHRLLKVARTIADSHFKTHVTCNDLKQALSYRQTLGLER